MGPPPWLRPLGRGVLFIVDVVAGRQGGVDTIDEAMGTAEESLPLLRPWDKGGGGSLLTRPWGLQLPP